MTRIVPARPKVTQESLGSIRDHRATVARRKTAYDKAKKALEAEEKPVVDALRNKGTVEEGPLKAALEKEEGSASPQYMWLLLAMLEHDYKGKLPKWLTRDYTDQVKSCDKHAGMSPADLVALADKKERIAAVKKALQAMYPGEPSWELVISGQDDLELPTEKDPTGSADELHARRGQPPAA